MLARGLTWWTSSCGETRPGSRPLGRRNSKRMPLCRWVVCRASTVALRGHSCHSERLLLVLLFCPRACFLANLGRRVQQECCARAICQLGLLMRT